MVADYKVKSAVKSTKILLIEDDVIMTKLVKDVLVVMGFTDVTTVREGEKALKEIALHNYDLIFCDWKMEGMDGIEFTRRLRTLPNEKCFIPVVMLTGKASREDVELARDMGVNEYMIKPFSVNSLCAKIKSILENPRAYILSDTYAGPDRRRKDDREKIPNGVDRRKRAS
jgi:DNA-binding response OmpR family regulator